MAGVPDHGEQLCGEGVINEALVALQEGLLTLRSAVLSLENE
jgi:hypothetical protein